MRLVRHKTKGYYHGGDKRQYFPYELKYKCPVCGCRDTIDFLHEYLDYPPFGVPFVANLSHYDDASGEDHEFTVEMQLDIEARLVSPKKDRRA